MHATAQAQPTRTATLIANDWALALASTWLVAGLHLDGWAHAHKPGLETFFTPWHAIMYSGFFALALAALSARKARGWSWTNPTILGIGVFFVGGAADMVWHSLLGIEVNVEALLSPTHLILAVGFVLMITAPLREARPTTGPVLVAAGLVIGMLSFFTQFIQPGGRAWALAGNAPTAPIFAQAAVEPNYPVFPGGLPNTEIALILGVAGILIATTIIMGVLAFVTKKITMPLGGFTVIMSLHGALLGLMRDTSWYFAVALVAGIAMDALYRTLPRRAFFVAAPIALWATYFVALAAQGGVWWSAHAWAGAIVLAGLAGWLLSHIERAAPQRI